MFQTVAAFLGEVHSCSREEHWMWSLSVSRKYI